MSKTLPEVLVVSGPAGSGKTSLVKVFMNCLIDDLDVTEEDGEQWMLKVDADFYSRDMNPLWNRVSHSSK